jgi:hypothetical protein
MRRTIAIAAATLALSGAGLFAGSTAFAGIGEELTLAQTHALLAYRSGGRGERGIAQARMHFHHVLNCLVGPGGKGYDLTPPVMPAGRGRGGADAAADAPPPAPATPPNMDPCASDKTNKGALNDAASPAQKQKVQAAIDLANTALTITENEKVTEAATALADAVGEAKETK